jgi:hypothetical protein
VVGFEPGVAGSELRTPELIVEQPTAEEPTVGRPFVEEWRSVLALPPSERTERTAPPLADTHHTRPARSRLACVIINSAVERDLPESVITPIPT